MEPLPSSVLPAGVRSRILPGINGLDIHILEAGFEPRGRPAVMLFHGFPELAFSWRRVMLPLARLAPISSICGWVCRAIRSASWPLAAMATS